MDHPQPPDHTPFAAGDRSVLLEGLGSHAALLNPHVREYAEGPGVGAHVRGEGTFRFAGSRLGRLNLAVRPVVGSDLLMTRYGRDVPFSVQNTCFVDESGATVLAAERVFRFGDGSQRFIDELRAGPTAGTLVNVVGRSRRIELLLRCATTDSGDLVLWSERAWLRLAGIRLRLPSFLSVAVHILHGYDEQRGLQTVTARVRNPLLGTVLEYAGAFDVWRGRGPGRG